MGPKRYSAALMLLLIMTLSANLVAEEAEGWPKKIQRGNTTVVVYQPQIESLTSIRMEARAAVSVTNEEFTSPVFGAMWFDCKISTDRDERTVLLTDVEVTASKFPEMKAEQVERLSRFLESEIPKWNLVMSLDQLVADLDSDEVKLGESAGLNNAPPEIIFRTGPSMLISVDGDPIFTEFENTGYERVINTPFFIARDRKKGIYYINGGLHWYVSDDLNRWEHTEKVPRKLTQIAQEALDEGKNGYNSEDVLEEAGFTEDVVPEIILRTTPSELLQSDGEPNFAPIQGTSALYMTNTADDILLDIDAQQYFVLVSGRWYRSGSLENGPWTFVEPDQVPGTFAEIPEESDMASVRSSIAGTKEAREAMLENQIPQTAQVDRNAASLEVGYDGTPKFEPIGRSGMSYAVNTDKSVLLIDGRYYCCDDAIWFESAYAGGPWIVSTSIPDQVQEIPPEYPVYNVKYVYIYDYTPSMVYMGYTPGYVNSYVYRGCVYYGTGYYYSPWYGAYYYSHPVTYGYNVHWNPYSGWGFSYSYSVGWMTVGWGSPYRGWWGPVGYRHGYHYGYHYGYSSGYRASYYSGSRTPNRPIPYSRSYANNNVYRNRSQGVARTGSTYLDPKTGNSIAAPDRTPRPTAQPANRANNVYTNRNGDVYRRDGDQWNRVENSASRSASGDRPSTATRGSNTERPATESRPPTGQRPATTERPSTGQRPATTERPSTGQRPTTTQRPSTGQQPTAVRPPASGQARPVASPSQNLNRDYNSRNRGEQRSQQYNENRNNYQYNQPAPSRSTGRSPSASPGSRERPTVTPATSGTRRKR